MATDNAWRDTITVILSKSNSVMQTQVSIHKSTTNSQQKVPFQQFPFCSQCLIKLTAIKNCCYYLLLLTVVVQLIYCLSPCRFAGSLQHHQILLCTEVLDKTITQEPVILCFCQEAGDVPIPRSIVVSCQLISFSFHYESHDFYCINWQLLQRQNVSIRPTDFCSS